MTYHLENTELVLEIARHRSSLRRPRGHAESSARQSSAVFSGRACLALFIGVAVLYVAMFSLLAGMPWAAAGVLVARAPQSF